MTKCKQLPEIPPKRYFTIGEVANLCDVKPHVLRYWEQEFDVIKPCKRRGSRRYYQVKDIELIREVRHLLYDKGFTIAGAKRALKGKVSAVNASARDDVRGKLKAAIEEVKNLISTLETA